MDFSRALTKPLMITGMLTVVAYGTAVRYLYPGFGLIAGTAGAYIISLASAYVSYMVFQKNS